VFNATLTQLVKASRALCYLCCLLSVHAQAQNTNVNLNFCVDPDWMPFEGVIEGNHTGIASDYLALFQSLTPYQYNMIPTVSWSQTIEKLKSGECDLSLMLNSSVERETYLSFTIPYFFGPNVIVSKSDLPFMQDITSVGDMTIGVVSGYRLVEEIPLYYPGVNITTVASEREGLEAVENGDIDVYVGSLYSINLRLEELGLTSLKINGWVSIQDKLRIGIVKKHEAIVPVLNQAIDDISSSQHNDILNKWSNVQIVKERDFTLFYYLSALTSFLLLVFLWRHMVSVRVVSALSGKNAELEKMKEELLIANERLEHLSFHDHLTQLYNRHYFMSTLKDHFNQLSRQDSVSAMLMIDIDYFKQINDKHGHVMGDKVLVEFSNILTGILRSGDVAARWGGEEFMILLPKATKEQSMFLAARLMKAVSKHEFESQLSLTISVGVVQYRKGESIASWIERADKALYQAKHDGRNCVKAID
jgi:diguanylate cyclase (GGDEF)-like protein